MNRRTLLAFSLLIPFAPSCAAAQSASQLELPLNFDDEGRPVVGVRINDLEPHPFVIDTAAQATALSMDFIARTGLTPSGGRAQLHGASGVTEVDLYHLARVQIGALTRTGVVALPLQPGQHGAAEAHSHHGHSGVIGAPLFAGARLDFDYRRRMLAISDAANRPSLPNATPIDLAHNTFVLVPARVAGVDATAVIDTGAAHTLANLALRDALGFTEDDPRLRATTAAGGATGHVLQSQVGNLADISIAGLAMDTTEVSFSAAPAFAALGLGDRPALIIGGNLLRRLSGFTIDYASRQFAARR